MKKDIRRLYLDVLNMKWYRTNQYNGCFSLVGYKNFMEIIYKECSINNDYYYANLYVIENNMIKAV